MTYSAWWDLHKDPIIIASPTALRVYASLLRDPLIFYQPRDIKAWLLAKELKTKERAIFRALSLLVERGYVIEYGRGRNNVRQLIVPQVRATPALKGMASPN